MERLPKDMLLKILLNVEDRRRLSDEELKKRIEGDKKELELRREKIFIERTKHIRNILLQIDLFSDIFDYAHIYENCKKYIKEGDWRFNFHSSVYLKLDCVPFSSFYSFSEFLDFTNIRGKSLAHYIRDYVDDNNEKKDKWNIFYSKENCEFKKEICKICGARQVSNYGCESLYLFDTGYYGEVDLFPISQINDGICNNCKRKT